MRAHTGLSVVGGEGHTVPERVGPRGTDNAANLVLACLPCAQAVNPPGRRPLPKKALHFTPTKWKSSKVVYIPKIGKENYALAKSYRTISLMYYLLKGLERLSVWVADTALENNPLHIKQHGFQYGKRTESAISNTVHKTYIKWGTLYGCIPRHPSCF